jgi:hypothetical protein
MPEKNLTLELTGASILMPYQTLILDHSLAIIGQLSFHFDYRLLICVRIIKPDNRQPIAKYGNSISQTA